MAEQHEPAAAAAVVAAAITIGNMLSIDTMDDVWGGLNCNEAEAFAELFRSTGHTVLAESVLEQHGWHDEEEDDHYDPKNEALHKSLHGAL